MSNTLRLSTASRRALRKAITDHAGWTSPFRNRQNLSLATMSRDDYLRAADLLGIDVAAIIAETEGDKAAAARDVFEKAAASAPTMRGNADHNGTFAPIVDTFRAHNVFRVYKDGEPLTFWAHVTDMASPIPTIVELSEGEPMPAGFVCVDLRKHGAPSDPREMTLDTFISAARTFIRGRTATATANNDKASAAAAAFQNDTTEKEKALMIDNSSAVANQLAALLAQLSSTTVDESKVREIVEREISTALEKHAGPVVRIEVTDAGLPFNRVEGRQHPEFAKMLRAATARTVDGYCPNIWIAGPAGSGKTYAVSKIAETLETPFHFNGAIGMAHELLGFVDAGGTYHETAFRRAYEHGGCYLFDEVDGSDNSALLALNAALANGRATFPDKVVTRHKDCRIFAAANTWGFGATAEYVGRAKLDAAFLSRFPVRIMWSYDDALEADICGHPDAARMVQRARRAAADLGLKVLITPRDSIACAGLVAAGFSLSDAAEMTYLAAMTADQRAMLENRLAMR